MFKLLKRIIADFSQQVKKEHIDAFAASSAFFIFLSFVPMLVLVCTIIPFTPLTEEILIRAVNEITPGVMNKTTEGIISYVYDKSAGVLSVAAVATLWTAGKAVMALMNGLNSVNGVEEERNYFIVRSIACFYTVMMLLGIILVLIIGVFGNQVMNIILMRVPRLEVLFSYLEWLRFLPVLLVLTILFAAIYAYVPDKRLHFREQIPGAFFSSVAWSAFSWGFSIYVDNFNSYSIYGNLSIMVIAMLWLYVCMYIVLIGAYLNKYFLPVNRVLVRRRNSLKKDMT